MKFWFPWAIDAVIAAVAVAGVVGGSLWLKGRGRGPVADCRVSGDATAFVNMDRRRYRWRDQGREHELAVVWVRVGQPGLTE